jgi:hypothetical protein
MKPFAIALLILFVTSIVQAQDVPPWPPDPAAIFADGVEVVSVEMLDNVQPSAINKPFMDVEGRAVVMPDGRVFPWLEEFPFASFYIDPGVNVNDYLYIAESRHPQGEIDTVWQLDKNTGVYSALESSKADTVCGPISLDFIKEKWVWLESRQYCEMATGKKTIPLSEDFIRLTDIYSQITRPIPTPDGQMLLILGKQADSDAELIAYRYDMADDSFEAVGTFTQGKFVGFEDWAGDRVAVLDTYGNRSGDVYPEFYGYVAIDLEKGDIRQWSAFVSPIAPSTWITYHTDGTPTITRREPINAEMLDASCRVTRDDILAHTTLSYEFPSACYPEYSVQNDDYYREISSDQTQSTVFKVNRSTGERADLYRGEIEGVVWVSPAEGYAALVLDNNGVINHPGHIQNTDTSTSDAQLALINLQTGDILYIIPADTEFTNTWTPSVRAFPDNRLELVTLGAEENTLIEFNEGTVLAFAVQGYIEDYLGNNWATIFPYAAYEEAPTQIGLYNVTTHQHIEVVTGAVYGYTTGALQPLGGDQFKVTISAQNNFFEHIGDAIYTISVPGVDIPATP